MPSQVQNLIPTVKHDDYKIAFIGEAPGRDEEQVGRPFVGASGNILTQCLNRVDIMSSLCLLGNVSQYRAPGDFAVRLKYDSWQVQEGLKHLRHDLEVYNPNLCVLLGDFAAKVAGYDQPVATARGSVFVSREIDSPFYGRKCLVTVNPAAVMRRYDLLPLFLFDMKRAREEGDSPEWVPPARKFDLHLSANEIADKLYNWDKSKIGTLDIEGGVNTIEGTHPNITCMAIADSPQYAFIIDFKNLGPTDAVTIYDALKWWLGNPEIGKRLQNGLYDNFCLSWKPKMPIANVVSDTMLSGWEIYPELPKGLDTQGSIWTREPYYKNERKILDDLTHHTYCCKDACVTAEIGEAHDKYLGQPGKELSLDHYRFNMDLLPAFMYMQLRGIKYDKKFSTELEQEVIVEMSELKERIDLLAGEELNPNSPKQMQKVLYTKLGLERQYKREGGRKTNKLTCDMNALLTLLKKHDSTIVYTILKWKQLEGLRKQLAVALNEDERIRCSYNPVGTDTGRLTCYKSNTGSGYNLQTTTKRLRKLFLADEGYSIFQIDLSGADGWTVAAHAARLGDSRMLDDYYAGVKPAKVICAMHMTGDTSLANLVSEDLRQVVDDLELPEWLYAAAKAVQHGSSYKMGKITMSTDILKKSWKFTGEPVYVSPADCIKLQNLFFHRYIGVKKWQNWVQMQLEHAGYLDCASGHRRTFFGRRTDNGTLQAALGHEPQANTTYATNLALSNLWNDPENRSENSGKELLRIQPLHQVHDAVIGQFRTSETGWAVDKLKSYFSNTLRIADRDIVIPYEGEYGRYWGDASEGTI